ncbi:hypothetical protein A1Q1_07556 [Trichosporon asahii var. asahii CBS 2479]|uniref:Uncharacterized protein n=1 Tax=Trichosporon asahii var. asahii (strain ATCC 90039 / CBS 2479 / JCM 2466 / KCTC 7840 / NBRC 103889/ NCYC 2677 / UAMH 7654) TaxID=1186058 RepID=J4UHY4_TRIAS|nr:hypothetical protein A1Q1_07556 [Trichosporon asahii var. asahii CBS 2479]EJT51245.1 hypothetical protein A1Q1_07556 [Trichosporon asahii var. asahii CBS 2479]
MPPTAALNTLLDANGVPITATRLQQLFADADAVQTQFRTVVAALASPMILNGNGAPTSSSPFTESSWSSLDAAGDNFDDACECYGAPEVVPSSIQDNPEINDNVRQYHGAPDVTSCSSTGARPRRKNIFAPRTPPTRLEDSGRSSPMSMTTVGSGHIGDLTTTPIPIALGSRRPRNIFAPVTPPAPQPSHEHSSPMSMTTVNSGHIVVSDRAEVRLPLLTRLRLAAQDSDGVLQQSEVPGIEEEDEEDVTSSSVETAAVTKSAAHEGIYQALMTGTCMDAQYRSIRQPDAVNEIAGERGLAEGGASVPAASAAGYRSARSFFSASTTTNRAVPVLDHLLARESSSLRF